MSYLGLLSSTMKFCVERFQQCCHPMFRRKARYFDRQHENKTQLRVTSTSSLRRSRISSRSQTQTMCLLLLWIIVSLTPVESSPYTFPMNSNGGSHLREVKIGVILTHTLGKQNLPKLPFAREMVMPAIVHAVEKLQNDPQSVLPGVKFTFTEKDSNCSNSNGPLAAIDLYRTKMAHIFMGPACDYAAAPVARYSGRWGIPVVTAGALFQSFSDKKQFPLLTRVQGSFHKVKEMFESILDHFNWTRIGMLFYEDVNHLGGEKRECLQILRPIYHMFTKEPPPYFNVKEAEFVDWRKHVASLSNNSRSE